MHARSRLRDIRLAAGLSEAQLAEKLGKSRTSIYKIEQGSMDPSHATLLSWVEACDHFVGVFPAKDGLLSSLSALSAPDQAIVADLIAILPSLSPEHREMYQAIFRGLSGLYEPKP